MKNSFPRFLSFTGGGAFLENLAGRHLLSSFQRFCSTISPELAVNWRLYLSISVPKLKSLIPISFDEKGTTSGAKASANHLAPFFLISISSGHAPQWAAFSSLSTRSQVVECRQLLAFHSDLGLLLHSTGWPRGIYLHSYPSFNCQSLGLVSSNIEE